MPEAPQRHDQAVPRPSRRGYLDWARGVAVLIMIEAHVVDSWTAAADRSTKPFEWAMLLGGFGAPLFLLLAGVSVSMSAGSKARRIGSDRAASLAVMRRGLEIFLLAFVFRVQAWILGWSSVRTLLRVDILNIMGPAIIAAAALWGLMPTRRSRLVAFTVATLAAGLVTPIVRVSSWLDAIPDPIEAYLRPAGGFTSFTLLPWAGFLFAGALIGVLLHGIEAVAAVRGPEAPPGNAQPGAASRSDEGRLNLALGVGGAALALAAFGGSFLPTPYFRSDFWTTSPAFFFLRLGVLTLTIGLAYAWQQRPGGTAWSPVQQLGRTSLFIYWIHVEMVYGLISLPLHHKLTIGQTLIGLAAFAVFMLGCSIGKDRLAAWWRPRRQPPHSPAPARVT